MKQTRLVYFLTFGTFILTVGSFCMKGDPTYTDQKHAKKLLFETGMLKCLSSGGTAGDIGNVQALVTEIISQNPTIAPSDESSQYFKSDAVHNCELAILNADIVACDFSDFIAADYFSGHKICHLTPSRKFRLDNQNH